MVIHATLLRATLEASMMHAAKLDSGVLAPSEIYTNAGKYHGAANYMVMVRHLLDNPREPFAGGGEFVAPRELAALRERMGVEVAGVPVLGGDHLVPGRW